MVMKLSGKESLEYLKDKGYNISHDTYYRYKRKIKESRFDRLSLIAKHGFVDQHLERIAQLELVNKEYWKLYNAEKNNMNKAQILVLFNMTWNLWQLIRLSLKGYQIE